MSGVVQMVQRWKKRSSRAWWSASRILTALSGSMYRSLVRFPKNEAFAPDGVDVARECEERPVEERKELLLRGHMARRDVREDMHPQGGLRPELGLDRLGFAEEIVLDQFVDVVLVFREEDRLTVRVVTGSTGPSAHLFDFHHRDRSQSQVHIESVQIPDHDPSGGGVHTLREGRSRHDAFDAPLLEFLLDHAPLVVRETRVMERDTPIDTFAEARGHRGRFLLSTDELVRKLVQVIEFLLAQRLAHVLRQRFGQSFC